MNVAVDGWVFDILEHFGNLMEYLKDQEKKKDMKELDLKKIECAKRKLLNEIQKIRDNLEKNKNI